MIALLSDAEIWGKKMVKSHLQFCFYVLKRLGFVYLSSLYIENQNFYPQIGYPSHTANHSCLESKSFRFLTFRRHSSSGEGPDDRHHHRSNNRGHSAAGGHWDRHSHVSQTAQRQAERRVGVWAAAAAVCPPHHAWRAHDSTRVSCMLQRSTQVQAPAS